MKQGLVIGRRGIPNLAWDFMRELGTRRRGVLAGNIWMERDTPLSDYEELGADYDEEDDDIFRHMRFLDRDDDDNEI